MTKTLLIMRHAKSDWDNTRLSDHARPLNKRGKQDAPLMGKLLKDEDLTPDLIITSTAERALTTAELVALACDYGGELVTTGRFYHADPATYLELLQGVDDQYNRVMIVGHNPGMEELLYDLTDQAEHFTTANIAHVELPISSWAQLNEDTTGNLLNLWRPKEQI
ncbi:MAG: histidine phosphatase family protein [Chloroflexi bacterium]|nr:histidine phosphatase family protein [Ardenticatenaceae bacterium]MBL1128623.1 histidine phosphatase family protein [Chloroflexota bacterium]NOG34702.1 histidine phosphatase family protein [Chloroflexota bacterium]GIK55087.1 MAG: phosphoglycerate mutase [Chloroflexota bacterium]